MLDAIPTPVAILVPSGVFLLLLFSAFNFGRAYQLSRPRKTRRLPLTPEQIDALQEAADHYDAVLVDAEQHSKTVCADAKADLVRSVHRIVGQEASEADNWSLRRHSGIVYGLDISNDP